MILTFALICIGIYCVVLPLPNPLNELVEIQNGASAIFSLILTIAMLVFLGKWIRKVFSVKLAHSYGIILL